MSVSSSNTQSLEDPLNNQMSLNIQKRTLKLRYMCANNIVFWAHMYKITLVIIVLNVCTTQYIYVYFYDIVAASMKTSFYRLILVEK